jgi:hypothetical protein
MNPLKNYAIRGDGTAETAERIRKVFEKVGVSTQWKWPVKKDPWYFINSRGIMASRRNEHPITLEPISIDQAEEIVNGSGERKDSGGWVSVEDGLPDDDTKVYLVVRDGDVEIEAWLFTNKKGSWLVNEGITHWQSLPNPPKTDKL